jgi:uncharacterized protein with GYD domain
MTTFILFGTYSHDALQGISADRTNKATDLVKKFGGTVKSMYALLGDRDLLLVLEFPDVGQAMKASVALSKLTGISFSTSPAVPVDEFDTLMKEI